MVSNTQVGFHILISMIKVWTPTDVKNISNEPKDALTITEVGSISISESYKKLIGEASVQFPRGTVVRKTVTEINEADVANDPALSASIMDNGVLLTTRKNSRLAEVSDFKIGNRIRIYLGYTTDPKIAQIGKASQMQSVYNNEELHKQYLGADPNTKCQYMTCMFDGYIVKCSTDSPIELQCESIASVLKRITCPDLSPKKNMTVNDFLAKGGKYDLLKGTGLELHPDTEALSIDIGKVGLTSDHTVADILTEWAKYKLFAFVKYVNGKPYVFVGRSYFSNAGKDSVLNGDLSVAPEIKFDYHVADNQLTLMSTDKAFLAVEAQGVDKEDKFIKLTVRLNPDYKSGDSPNSKWLINNESKLSKKAMKSGATPISKASNKVDLSKYTIVPYMSRKMGITNAELKEEAIKFFESYNMNGIEGKLVLFGDLSLRTATKVKLTDKRSPAKNGYYLVEEVDTDFGVNGYRQTITLPYCITRKSNQEASKTNGNK